MEKQSRRIALLVCLLAVACGGLLGAGGASGQTRTKAVEGVDYLVLKRVRILDEMGFDKPVEAMSVLVPGDWQVESGVRWKGVNECRSEIVTWQLSAKSPDGAIRFMVLPVQGFVYSQDAFTQQSLMSAASQGGCKVSPPFSAEQYVKNLARGAGASVGEVRTDESRQPVFDKLNRESDAQSRQYGTGITTRSSIVYGTLSWKDGTKGLAHVGVTQMVKQGRDMYTGAPNGFASTMVFYQVVMRYPADREAEALKIFGTITSNHRVNPVWFKAKEDFLARLGNAEHAGRMERLRLMGEQARAYAKSQSEAADARMRDWERSQSSSSSSSSSDDGQRRFIQTIREVETWKDGDGNAVELGAGYSHAWSRPDGSYILTNNSLFNPAVETQENWTRMRKQP